MSGPAGKNLVLSNHSPYFWDVTELRVIGYDFYRSQELEFFNAIMPNIIFMPSFRSNGHYVLRSFPVIIPSDCNLPPSVMQPSSSGWNLTWWGWKWRERILGYRLRPL
jgi:hypothetical protein